MQSPQSLNFQVTDLKRFYYDTLGAQSLSLEKINSLLDGAKDVYPDINVHYYNEREDMMKDYLRRLSIYQHYLTTLGIVHDRSHVYNKIIAQHRVNLDYGEQYMHFLAFEPAVALLASPSQYEQWMPRIREMKILGAYAQTEVGHGSDVQNIETTATYDEITKEFVFHTPRMEAAKFWPGGMAKGANYVVVYAQLISNGKRHGVHAFLIQIRDMKTHMPLPGLEIGDIGPKLGFNCIDNGYLLFNNFRQPKDCLLERYVELKDDGAFLQKSKNSTKLAYGGMLNLRINIIFKGHYYMSKFATISTRYSLLRHQFPRDDRTFPTDEVQIMDYQMQQHKIVPIIAASWAILFASNRLQGMYSQYQVGLKTLSSETETKVFSLLSDIHALAAGMKTLSTSIGEKFGEFAKQACGGNGYLKTAGLADAHIDYGVGFVTAEGDNQVMLQQTSRYLVNKFNTKTISIDKFMFNPVDYKNISINDKLLLIYEMRWKIQGRYVVQQMERMKKDGLDYESEIWNQRLQVDLVNLSKYYVSYFTVQTFYDVINGKEIFNCDKNMKQRDQGIQQLMTMLFQTYAIFEILEDLPSFYMNCEGDIVQKEYPKMLELYKENLKTLSKNSAAIVDGWDLKDQELLSVIGKSRQDYSLASTDEMYKEMIDVVRRNPLNKNPVTKGFNQYIRPILLAKL